jgi:hypothetical protein
MVAPSAQVPLLGKGSGPLGFRGAKAASSGALLATLGRLPCKSLLCFFPLHTAPVASCVVTPATTALRLSPRGRAFTGEVRAATHDAQGRVSAVTLRVAKTLAALALQTALWRNVRLHRHSQNAELGERSHPRQFRAPYHVCYEVRGRRAVLGGVPVAAAGAEQIDTQDTNVQSPQPLTDDALRHWPA